VVHAPRDSAKMSTKVKYWKIFNYRLQELTDNVDTKNANPHGASRAMIVLVPLLIFTALIVNILDWHTKNIYLCDINNKYHENSILKNRRFDFWRN
jgi:hypothetical protein